MRLSRSRRSRSLAGTSRSTATARDDPDRHVDQEQPAPAVVLAGGGDDQPAEHRAGGRRGRDGEAEQPERAAALGAAEQLLDQPGVLRGQQAGRRALHQAGQHHQRGAGRQADGGAGDHEAGQPDQHHPAPAVGVAEPAAGDQRQPEGERVARDDPLDGARGGVEAALHRGDRDVDDRDVEQRHEADDERDAEDPPAAGVGLVVRLVLAVVLAVVLVVASVVDDVLAHSSCVSDTT